MYVRPVLFVAAGDAGSYPDHHARFVQVYRVQEGQGGGAAQAVAGGGGSD